MTTLRGDHATRIVLDLYAALRDRRTQDMLAILDPRVVCYPLVRPGQSVYDGHDGMIRLMDYLHNAHGDYQVQIGQITVQDGQETAVTVRVHATVVPEPGHGPPVPVTTVYTVRNGLITWIESEPGTSTPHIQARAQAAH